MNKKTLEHVLSEVVQELRFARNDIQSLERRLEASQTESRREIVQLRAALAVHGAEQVSLIERNAADLEDLEIDVAEAKKKLGC